MDSSIFRAYDIRGIYPKEIDEQSVNSIARAYAAFVRPVGSVAVGRDVRLSSPSLQNSVIEGLLDSGVDVIDIGEVPTELIYFAAGSDNLSGAIQVSASHNPAEYNGLKMVRENVCAISSDNGLLDIKNLALSGNLSSAEQRGRLITKDYSEAYITYLSSLLPNKDFKMRLVMNGNFGLSAKLAKELLQKYLPNVEIFAINDSPDGSFPKGRPDPHLPENRKETSEMVSKVNADMAVAWDADGDRCYIADEKGEFIEGSHLTALLAKYLLSVNKGQKVIYDPRNIWAIEDAVSQAGGQALMRRAGHTFIKNSMRKENALFAGEATGHFYFRDFYFADNGLIPFILMLKILEESNQSVSDLASYIRQTNFVSGEINFKNIDTERKLKEIAQRYKEGDIDMTDGLSISFEDWRFNIRAANTEPLLRLNVESKDKDLLVIKKEELETLIKS